MADVENEVDIKHEEDERVETHDDANDDEVQLPIHPRARRNTSPPRTPY